MTQLDARSGRPYVASVLVLAIAVATATACLAQARPGGAVVDAEPVQAAEASADTIYFRQRIAEARAAFDAQRHARAWQLYQALLADPAFNGLDAPTGLALLSLAAQSAMKSSDAAGARPVLERAIAAGSTEPDHWYWLSGVAFDLDDVDAAAVAMTGFVEQWPELLPNIDRTLVPQLVHRLEPTSASRLALLQALFDANWSDPAAGPSQAWFQLALLRIERGEVDAARAAARRVTDPDSLVAMRSDLRFDPLLDRASPRADVARAIAGQIDRLRNQMLSQPDRLDPRVQLGYALLTAGRNQDVIALADEAVAQIASAAEGGSPFVDIADQVWLMNNRAIALRRLGRTEEALAELRRASRLGEAGESNVSQILNLGQLLVALGQLDAAVATVAEAGDMSGVGLMVKHATLHAAACQRGDEAAADAALGYLAAHEEEARTIYLDALVDADRLDQAAAYLLALLADPYDRVEMLLWLQRYLPVPVLPGQERFEARRVALLARPDVLAAVARVGRIEDQPMHGSSDM